MKNSIEKLNINAISLKLKPVFIRHGVKKAILFGSVARNCHDRYSDVDIVVDSGLKGIKFFGLLEDVVNVLECDVDLIDTNQIVKNSKIDEVVKNTGVLIYG